MIPQISASSKPSQVQLYFSGSPLQKLEKEVLMSHIVAFCTEQNDLWGTPIPLARFIEFLRREDQSAMPKLYRQPTENPFIVNGLAEALQGLVESHFLQWQEGEVLCITQLFIDLCAQYVTEPVDGC